MNHLYHTCAKLFQKLKFLTSLIHIYVCVLGVRNVTFSESFAYVLNGWHHTESVKVNSKIIKIKSKWHCKKKPSFAYFK